MEMVLIADALQVFLVILLVFLARSRNNTTIAIVFSLFSLLTALLFFLNQAPDVALAEIAVGSAIMPLILILSISKQREFMVDDRAGDDFTNPEGGEGYKLLKTFAGHYNLNLKICRDGRCDISGVFRQDHVDLIVERQGAGTGHVLKGKKSSVLMNRLELAVKDMPDVSVLTVEERDGFD